jgi:CRISPR/Cas system-associated exonuclease Cas4 (RecB family)
MMDPAVYDAGMAAFRASIAEAKETNKGKPWRAGGRATKQYPNKEDESWWMSEGPTMVHNYYNWRLGNPNLDIWRTPQGTPAIELGVMIHLPGDLTLRSYIDRVFVDKATGQTMIVDLKTGQPPKSALQLAVYRLALQAQYGEAPDYGSYWMARSGTLDAVHDLRQYPLDMVQRWLRDVKRGIDAGIFVPNVTNLCASCGVQKFCYAFGHKEYQPDFGDDLIGEE